jgi:DNA-binding response OmpR family regulator
MKILVVDDYPGAAFASRMLFELLGHECHEATTGSQALAALDSFDPDAVVLDLGLPDVSGYDIARQIRARPRAQRVFIAALTGWATSDDRVRSLAAGIDLLLLKPPTREMLELIVRSAAQRPVNGAGEGPA